MKRRKFIATSLLATAAGLTADAQNAAKKLLPADPVARPFGPKNPNLDSLATGEWWTKKPPGK